MRQRTRIIIGCLTVAMALAAAINTAAARRIEISEQRFLILFRELTFEGAGVETIVCPINLEGSFHSRTISKVSGQLIGYITEATVNAHPCPRGNMWWLNGVEVVQGITSSNTLPWHVLYLGFRGTLPRIMEIEIALVGAKFRRETSGILCLFATTTTAWIEGQLRLEAASGRVTAFRFNEERRISLFESQSGAFCPSTLLFSGEGTVGTQTGWREITVRLVQ
jgi:hypothetical protein